MGNKVRIGPSETVSLCIVFIISKLFLSYQLPILDAAATAAWMVVLAASLIGGLVFYWILVSLLNQYPGKNIVEIGEELAGPALNTIFSLGYLAYFLSLVALTLRQFSERVITGFVEEMPISFAVFSFAAGMVAVSYFGLEAITRTARIFVPILLTMFLFLVAATIPFWKPYNLYPLLGAGIPAVLATTATKLGLVSEIFILAVINHALPEKRLKAISLWSLTLSGFFLTLSIFASLLVFPYAAFTELTLQTFELSKIIYLGRFFQRLETLFLPVWALSGLLELTIGIYAASFIAAAMLKLPYYRPFILPMTVIAIAVAFLPESTSRAVRWDNEYLRNYLWVTTIIPPFIYLGISRFRQAKGGEGGGG